MNTSNHPFRKTLAMILSVAMVLGMAPITAFAEGGSLPIGARVEIIAFEPLEDNVANRMVPLGTSLEDLDLLSTLTATVEMAQPEAPADGVQDSGEGDADETEVDGKELATPSNLDVSGGEGGNTPLGSSSDGDNSGTSQLSIPVPVTWAAQPDYDGDTAGTYIFTAEVAGFSLADEVQPPQITVTVGEAAGGVITAFAELDEDIRFQRGYTPDLPETLEATVGGETVTVPVTWASETDATQKGLHVFVATPGAGYTLAEGVKKPVLSFFRTPMVVLFMAGSGNTGDELKITTADQLAEIAALTNAGKLEEMVFGEGATAQVHLKLMNDLDIACQGDADGWVPIGKDYDNQFKGAFNGNGKTITGLTIDRNSSNQGLFGVIGAGGVVSGLGLVKVSVSGNDSVGGAAGAVNTGGTIENCFVAGSVSGSSVVGGVAGGVVGTLTNCYSTGSVSRSGTGGNAAFGGVAGAVYGTVQNCYSTGSVNGTYNVGGVAGSVASGKVLNCAALNPSVSGSDVGRVVSQNFGGILTGNIAFSGMTGGGSAKTHNGLDGEDKTATDIAGSETLFGLFTAENGWETANGFLPGLFGQPVEMPLHLLDSGNPFAGGDGSSAENAYQIKTEYQLARLAELVNGGESFAGKYFKLMNDLDLGGIDPKGDKTGWVPIGTNVDGAGDKPFSGFFDGGGHVVKNMTIHNPSLDRVGLFGLVMGSNAVIQNLGVENANILGGDWTGGVVGWTSGNVENCFVTGNVNGKSEVGGVAGEVNTGTVENCYSTGSVTGIHYVGGVAGLVAGTVQNCYSTGSINGNGNVGGVAGSVSINGTVQNCYSTGNVTATGINIHTGIGGVTGYVNSGGKVTNCAALNPSVKKTNINNVGRIAGYGTGDLTGNIAFSGMTVKSDDAVVTVTGGTADNKNGEDKTAAAIAADSFFQAVFDSTVAGTAWTYAPGSLPGLFGQTVKMPGHINESGSPFAGLGTVNSPYQIETEYQLARLAELVNSNANDTANGGKYAEKYYNLMNDLDLSGYASGEGWVPIGINNSMPFKGRFDGGGKTITGLTINRSSDCQGLFGWIGTGGAVSGLGLEKVSISGKDIVGGVAGYVSGTLSNCFVNGSVNGNGKVGGVTGVVGGKVQNCYSTGSVTATGSGDSVGGVAGVVGGNCKVQNCYSTGSVNGDGWVGGVAGWVDGTVENCYSTGSVNGNGSVGSVAGRVNGTGKVINCAALNPSVTATASTNVGRVVGESYGTLSDNYAFSGMTVTAQSSPKTLDRGADKHDGADMTATEAITPGFWTNTMGWDITNVWDAQIDNLPILQNVGGVQSGASGLYLTPKSAENLTVAVNPASYTYTGSEIIPTVEVSFGTTTLEEGQDYTLAVTVGGTNVGSATVTVTGISGYSGTKNATFTISKAAQAAPQAPTLSSRTAASVTLNTISGAEYRCGSGAWQSGNLFTGLTPNTPYSFYQRLAGDANHEASPESPEQTFITDKAALTGTVSIDNTAPQYGDTLTASTAALSSEPVVAPGEFSYQWKREGMSISGATASTYTVGQEDVGKSITVEVTAANCTGSVTSTQTAVVSATVPGAPTGLTATPGNGQLALSWTAPASNGGSPITNYQYSASTGADSWQDVPGSGPSTTGYTITGLANGTTYTVKVRAVNSEGSGAEASTTGTPATVPGAPTSLTATPGNGQLALSWTAPASDGGSPITNYQYSASTGADSWQDVPGSGPSTTGYTITGLTNGTTYTVKVRAVNDIGAGVEASITGTPISGGTGGSSSDSDADKPITVIPPDRPNMPTVAKREVSGKVENKVLIANITEQMARDAIAAAEKAAKDANKTADGIAVEFNLTGSGDYASLAVNFDAGAIDRLKATGVKVVKIGSTLIDISLDAKAIAEIDRQSTGTVTLSATREEKLSYPASTAIGHRPAFDMTLKDSKGTAITDLKGGTATIGIAYNTKNNGTGGLYAVYVKPNGQIEWLQNSSYTGGRLIFGTGHFSIFGVGYKAPVTAFTDIKGHWARENMEFAASRGLLTGTSATKFSPNTSITRGMFITALGRLSGQDMSGYTVSSFSDVKSGSYYLPYIEWGVKNKIVSGVGDGKFDPDRAITREEMAVMLYNYTKATGYTLPVSVEKTTFTDGDNISLWAKDAVKALQQAGIVSGVGGGKFNPKGTATRAEAATILRNLVERVIDESTARGWSRNDAGQWMYYDWQGKRTIGWLSILNSDAKYYFDANGVMVSSKWLQIGGKWYYFYSDGKMARSATIDGHKIGEDGTRQGK